MTSAAPDVVLVTIDTLRADHTTVYGYSRPTTPALEAVAREGTVVELVYAPMATTAPSHASMLTSAYPWSHGVTQNGLVLAARWQSLPELFRQARYATAGVVSAYVLKGMFGFAQGFDHFEDTFDAETASRARGRAAARLPSDRRAEATTALARRWLAARDVRRPFFLWVHYYDPHEPYLAPPPWDGRFEGAARPGSQQERIADYDAEISYVDDQVRVLLEALDPSRTLLAITADHGEGLWQHGHRGHGVHLYEEAVRVPMIVRWPGHVAAAARIAGPVEQVDLAPTLLELAGLPPSSAQQGRSFAAALLGAAGAGAGDPNRPVFLQRRSYEEDVSVDGGVEIRGSKFAVRQGPYKYIEAHEERTRELYDLGADPGETHNLFESRKAEGERLARLLEVFRQSHERGAPGREDRSPDTEEALKSLGYVR